MKKVDFKKVTSQNFPQNFPLHKTSQLISPKSTGSEISEIDEDEFVLGCGDELG